MFEQTEQLLLFTIFCSRQLSALKFLLIFQLSTVLIRYSGKVSAAFCCLPLHRSAGVQTDSISSLSARTMLSIISGGAVLLGEGGKGWDKLVLVSHKKKGPQRRFLRFDIDFRSWFCIGQFTLPEVASVEGLFLVILILWSEK